MTAENALKSTLPCPVCGARTFYLDQSGTMIFFSLDSTGRPERVTPQDAAPNLSADTPINCAHCSWSGTIAGLLAEHGPKE